MANDSKIVITAGLQIPETIHNIQDELTKEVAPNLSLEISCVIKDNSLKAIQEQISSISKTLDINVDAQNIQQSIKNAVNTEPVKISVEADIKSGELKRQAKEFKEIWNIGFAGESKERVKELNAQLREMLAEYDKAKKSMNYDEILSSWEKLTNFVNEYGNSIRKVTPEAQKLNDILSKSAILIEENGVDYKALEQIYKDKNKITEVLNNTLGIGNWSYYREKASYGFDQLVTELNSDLFKDADKISEHIVEGLEKIASIRNADKNDMAEWEKYEEQSLARDASYWESRKNAVLDSLYAIRKEEIVNFENDGWVDILSDDEIKHEQEQIRSYAEILEEGKRKIEDLKIQIKAESGDEIKGFSSRFTADAEGNLNGFVLAIQKSNGEVENLYHKLVEVEDETGKITREWARTQITGSDSGIEKFLVKATKAANALERQMINLKAAADDQSAPRPITSEESIGKVTEAYNKATLAIEKLRTADATTFTELDNEARKAVDELNNVIKTARNADTAATKLRAKPIETIKAEETAGLSELSTTISNSVIPNVEILTSRIETLRSELGEVKDKQGLTDYLNKLTELEADFKAIEAQAKAVKAAISDLDKVSGSAQFKNNASNPDVVSQMSNISAIRNEYTQLLKSLEQAKSPEAIQAISNKLAELKPRFDAVISSSNALSNTLKNDDATAKFGAKLDALRNRMEAFANANQKAIESTRKMRSGNTFAEEWQNMLSQLNNPNIDANGLQRLTEQFRNFTGEARTAGTVTSHLFDNMENQLKMMASRWVSLYAIIGKIRTMINYVTELDAAMTKLKRVTDETAKGYEDFLEVAKNSARETNTTLVDTVEQAAKWAKSGYDAATSAELAKTSLIYSIVGDIDNDTAVSDLVTAIRGFRLEAEDAMSVVDKLDALNNKYATDAKSLGEGLRVSASAMAAANNDLDQTLALLTGATEITQNAQETGQAIKTITMRLRGKLYASIQGNLYALIRVITTISVKG